MAVTVTYDKRQQTNKSIGAAMSRGKKAVSFDINFSGLSVVATGITMTVAGMTTVDVCLIDQKSGYQVYYEASSTVIKVPQLVSGTSLGSWTTVNAWAWGD